MKWYHLHHYRLWLQASWPSIMTDRMFPHQVVFFFPGAYGRRRQPIHLPQWQRCRRRQCWLEGMTKRAPEIEHFPEGTPNYKLESCLDMALFLRLLNYLNCFLTFLQIVFGNKTIDSWCPSFNQQWRFPKHGSRGASKRSMCFLTSNRQGYSEK